jgi:hypothetical protein
MACRLFAKWGGVGRNVKEGMVGSLKCDYRSVRIGGTESTLWHLNAKSPLSDEIKGIIILVNKRSTILRKHPYILDVLPDFTRN